jgi:tetratricopeptide (TPR) repeat protein
MKYFVFWGSLAVLGLYANVANAKSSAEIQQLSRSVTVKITNQLSKEAGSGFIVQQKGNVYTIVTNRHVACANTDGICANPLSKIVFTLTTADGQKHRVLPKMVKILGQELDLAVMQFTATQKYPVVQLDTNAALKADDMMYVGGFPFDQTTFRFSEGQVKAAINKRLPADATRKFPGDSGGYTIMYDAITSPGMSGSAVLNQAGQVVAIHGQGDRFRRKTETSASNIQAQEGVKIGINRGIPVGQLLNELKKIGIDLGTERPSIADRTSEAEEYLVHGYNRWIAAKNNNERREAIQLYTKAIELNPKQAKAYVMRGYIHFQLEELDLAMQDYNASIKADPNDSYPYFLRGFLKSSKLKDFSGAVVDNDRVIVIKPKYVAAYINRGSAKSQLNDVQGALADFNQAISLAPQDAYISYGNGTYAYIYRGVLKSTKLNDANGAMADYNKAIELDPKNVLAYTVRGILKKVALSDRPGAITDLQKAKNLYEDQDMQNELGVLIRSQLKELGISD